MGSRSRTLADGRPGYRMSDEDKAICLVRDGRDCLVSWARHRSESGERRVEDELRALITRPDERGAGQWGRNVLSWLQPSDPARKVLRYEELASEPGAAVGQVVSALNLRLTPAASAAIPSFAELQQIDGRFFRIGYRQAYSRWAN